MSFIHSIQSMLPRPENRSRGEIERDLEDEFAFHVEMKARSLMSQRPGLERDEARAVAQRIFGDVKAVKGQCRRIALRERIMLQRVNFVLMVVVTLLVIGVGAQVMITQRYNTLALQAITTDLARMKFQDLGPAAPSAAVAPFVYIDGDVQRPGVFALPPFSPLTLSRAITAAGGAKARETVKVMVHANDREGKSIVRFIDDNYALKRDIKTDYVLEPNDRVVVTATPTPATSVPSPDLYGDLPDKQLAGRWVQVDADRQPLASGVTMELVSRDDIRNVNTWPVATLQINPDHAFGLNFLSGTAPNLQVRDATGTIVSGRWEYRDDQLLLNITPAAPWIAAPIALMHESMLTESSAVGDDARAAAVGDFVVRLFALADPNDPNLDRTVRTFLDTEEAAVDRKYPDDPAIAGMIKDLIAARRKIFEADAAIHRAATAEEKTRAVSAFLQDVLTASDTTPNEVTVRDVLDNASQRIDEQFGDNPELAAQMRERIAEAKRNLDAQPAAPGDGAPAATPNRANDDEFPELSPFKAVRWKDYTPFVNVAGTWGELVSIEGVPAAEIVDFCRKRYGDKDRKRFTEDLIQAMTEMGKPLTGGAVIRLQIKDIKTGTIMSIERAAMTEANRGLLWDANNAAGGNTPPYPEWTGEPPPASQQPPDGAGAANGDRAAPATLTLPQMEKDLAALEQAMRERSSYLHLRDVALDQSLAALRDGLKDGMPLGDFAFEVQKFIARFGDGHAGVSGLREYMLPVYAPFQMRGAHDGRIVAFAADASALLDPSHPYLVSINGVPIERLLDVAKTYVVDGSPALVRRRSIDIAHRLGLLAEDPSLTKVDFTKAIVVELASAGPADGTVNKSLGPPLDSPRYASRPDRVSGLIEDDAIGYIRIAEMDEESARLAKWLMPQFKNTRGLIIDVRGNGGGSRDALLTLLPHVLALDAPPLVLNIAAYRLNGAFSEDHLDSRFMYRRDDPHWSDAERTAIDAATVNFTPKWLPPEGLAGAFSEWHYLVVSSEDAAKSNGDLYHYDKPVIVLLDGECFSATDIFLGAFKGLPNVTLLGTTSSGGSGRKQSLQLPHSRLTISLSSMISYLPDGSMFDLRGVEPDLVFEPIPTDFVVDGGTDSQLDAAVARLMAR